MKKAYEFVCEQCGATLYFSASEGELICSHCSHINTIERSFESIVEKDYEATISRLKAVEKKALRKMESVCSSCGATFELHDNVHASECPYCSSPIVNETTFYRPIPPQGILPFKITQKEAQAHFEAWLDGRWFAPNKLKAFALHDDVLKGIYIPYWSYDADTYTNYRGRSGEKYYEEERYSEIVENRSVTKRRQVEKVRWRDVSGDFNRHFDDVLVMATKALKQTLSRWDLENLVDYDPSYLSGYESELYSVALDDGLISAKSHIDFFIRSDIKMQIGGDIQEIDYLSTDYTNITYKHILLPLYASAFELDGKVYSYVINGRNGDISGDRPYSVIKIALSIGAVVLSLGILYYFFRG